MVQPPTSQRPCWSPAEPTEFRSEPTEQVENLEDDEDTAGMGSTTEMVTRPGKLSDLLGFIVIYWDFIVI